MYDGGGGLSIANEIGFNKVVDSGGEGGGGKLLAAPENLWTVGFKWAW